MEDICYYIKHNNKNVRKLGFIHHGRAILQKLDYELEKAKEILGGDVLITEDGTTIEM